MPVTYCIQENLFVLECHGTYTTAELRCSFEEALADKGFPVDANFVLNVGESESLAERTISELRQMAFFFGVHCEKFNNCCAIVATDSLHYGLMRMASVFAQTYGMKTSVFKNMDEAQSWFRKMQQKTGQLFCDL